MVMYFMISLEPEAVTLSAAIMYIHAAGDKIIASDSNGIMIYMTICGLIRDQVALTRVSPTYDHVFHDTMGTRGYNFSCTYLVYTASFR